MDGPSWSLLLDLPPIRRELRREIGRARDEIEQQALEVLAKDRERHRTALDQSEQRIGELERSIGELRGRAAGLAAANRDFEAVNRDLRGRLLTWQQAEQRRREREATDARNTTSDLFCCQNPDCASLWLLSMRPDHSYTVHGPIGPGCATCTDGEPLLRLAAVKAGATRPDEIEEVARPLAEAPERTDLSVPGDRAARTDIGVTFVADLLQDGPDSAIAETVAHQASTFVDAEVDRVAPATRCAGLAAIADGLDQVPKVIRNGIAWCATEIVGMPDFPARVLGEVVTHLASPQVAPLHALHAVAQGIRAVGTVSCAADDRLGQCKCARDLVADVAETAAVEQLRQLLDRLSPTGPPSPLDELSITEDGPVLPKPWWHGIGGG